MTGPVPFVEYSVSYKITVESFKWGWKVLPYILYYSWHVWDYSKSAFQTSTFLRKKLKISRGDLNFTQIVFHYTEYSSYREKVFQEKNGLSPGCVNTLRCPEKLKG